MISAADEKALTYRMVELYDKLTAWEHRSVKDSGLTLSQMHTLEIIGHAGSIMMKDLSTRMGVTMGTSTVLVDRLERDGLVVRKPNPDDGRSYLLELTEKGRMRHERHHRDHLELTSNLCRALTEQEAVEFSRIMEKMISHF